MMRIRGLWMGTLAVALLALAGGSAEAMTLGQTNFVDLLRDSEGIVVGGVQTVTDGIDAQGMPYTEVTVAISESIRGDLSGSYTFRQFGLREPRLTEDGTKLRMPAPDGFPKYEEGEEVVLFLYRAAAWTGLRTTVGLAAGKFTVGPGRVENALANEGLFKNVAIGQGLATANDDRILGTEVGAVNPDDFLSLVRRAVTQNWVESCQMWKTDEGMPNCGHGPRRPVRRSRPGTTLYPGATTQQGGSQTFGKN